MTINPPTQLTLLRIGLIPVLVTMLYMPFHWANEVALIIYLFASLTDLVDGWWARRSGQVSRFGAFLDPVADKLMVCTILVIVVQQNPNIILALAASVIICREVLVSALREWMSEMGRRGLVAVGWLGKLKTVMQMTAIGFLVYSDNLWRLPMFSIGLILLLIAAALTLWSMMQYLQAARPTLFEEDDNDNESHEQI